MYYRCDTHTIVTLKQLWTDVCEHLYVPGTLVSTRIISLIHPHPSLPGARRPAGSAAAGTRGAKGPTVTLELGGPA